MNQIEAGFNRGFLRVSGARLAAWRRRHPRQAAGGLFLVTALLGWAGCGAYWYFAARAHLRAAQQALDRRAWSEAGNHAAACLYAWPDSPAAHLLAARAARRLKLLNEAEAHLDSCRRLEGLETRAALVERALLRVARGDLSGAEAFLRDCVARDDPDAVEILDVLAAALVANDRVPDAHWCLGELLQRQSDNFDALVRHGTTAETLAWHATAVESFRKAVALRPDDHRVRFSLALELVSAGQYPEALEHVTYLSEQQPDNPSVVVTLAQCLFGTGRKEQAAELLDGLLAKEPNNWMALGERGWLSMELDRFGEAEGYLRRARALAPPSQTLLTRLAGCLRLLGKHDEARQCRNEAERIGADLARASQLARRIREENSTDPEPCHELACIYLRLGREQAALQFFTQALAKNPKHRPTHESLAAHYTKLGDHGQAAYHKRQLGQNP